MLLIEPHKLSLLLREIPSRREFDLRTEFGVLVLSLSRHECEVLADERMAEGVADRKGNLRYLRLIVPESRAKGRLRRRVYATGRTVATACQLTIRDTVPGGGIVYSHFGSRTQYYAPEWRALVNGSTAAGEVAMVEVPGNG